MRFRRQPVSLQVQLARKWINAASRVVGFTGAGISTESGVSDFRSPNGVWARNRAVYYQEFISNEEDRIEAWRQKVESWPEMRDAKPNSGHMALVELYRAGKLSAMITQNIERLHQRSGIPSEIVFELHGTTTEAMCLTCGDRIDMEEAVARVEGGEKAPLCRKCGGLLKPATVSFGQPMPVRVVLAAQQAAESCDLFLAVGSSLVVQPAASLPVIAKNAGAKLIIVNREETPVDSVADLVLHGEIGDILPVMVGMASAGETA
ncbi:MAG: NAD-dependent deacetylase [Acidobacteriia bacterium]|nr:NAD-dependent deacetylase [Terriglobia bacterium]